MTNTKPDCQRTLAIWKPGQPVASIKCECGKADIVILPNGEHCCGDTLRKFEIVHGRQYKGVAA